MAERPLSKRMAEFVKFHLADKHCFSPFTGQDFSAWNAFLYTVELYGRSDYRGQDQALKAMRACVGAAQRTGDVLACFKKAIPGVLDWGYERQLWNEIYPRSHAGDTQWINPIDDGERVCAHIHSKPHKKLAGYFKCKECGAEWRPSASDEGELAAEIPRQER